MDLVVDDREHAVIIYLEKIFAITIKRITVGDYAFIYNGRVIVIVERKTLSDLAASLKDGRMSNNDKLLDAQKKHGCRILYIIEGPAYPNMSRKFGRIPYKCLQGKLDSLLFRHDVKIIWTRDAEHTAQRLVGLCAKFTTFVTDGVFDDVINRDEKLIDTSGTNKNGGVEDVVNIKHDIVLDDLYVKMLQCYPYITRKSAIAILRVYTIQQYLLGQVDMKTCYNCTYASGFRLGARGEKIYKQSIAQDPKCHIRVLACINGLTHNSATCILQEVNFSDIVSSVFEVNSIANIYKKNSRRIGPAIEMRIRRIFPQVS